MFFQSFIYRNDYQFSDEERFESTSFKCSFSVATRGFHYLRFQAISILSDHFRIHYSFRRPTKLNNIRHFSYTKDVTQSILKFLSNSQTKRHDVDIFLRRHSGSLTNQYLRQKFTKISTPYLDPCLLHRHRSTTKTFQEQKYWELKKKECKIRLL